MKKAKDLFSSSSGAYFTFRPHYPDEWYSFLFSHLGSSQNAWDCGTGNGQVAVKLAERFDKVVATDISEKQLAQAPLRSNIEYRAGRAELSGLPEGSMDLIAVAQAIHWFDFEAFYGEVRRVAAPGAILAIWGYGLVQIPGEAGALIRTFYSDLIRPYWDAERRYIDEEYRSIPFPFPEISVPPFSIQARWTLRELEGYLGTWSGLRAYVRQTGKNPLPLLMEEISKAWGKTKAREINFPLFFRVGRLKTDRQEFFHHQVGRGNGGSRLVE